MNYEIKLRDAKELLNAAAPYNPRYISDQELEALTESIKRFGFVVPVVVNSKTGRIVSGHQRAKAAERLGIQVPTIEVELDETAEKLLNVAMNRIRGKFDAEKLGVIFQELAASGEDVDITGFTALEVAEVNVLLGGRLSDSPTFPLAVFKINKRAAEGIRDALRKAKGQGAFTEYEGENENSNGNALARIAEWVLSKGLPST